MLFAKAPVPGRVKTRLQPAVDPVCSAELHSAFVRDMLEVIQSLSPWADVELWTDTPTDAWREFDIPRHLQAAGDLGQRLHHALEGALGSGRPAALAIGSDAPTLPAAHLSNLLQCKADIALGPTEDGGYYAICCKRAHPEMFRGVRWSEPDTLECTVRAVRSCGFSIGFGPTWFDVDELRDLTRLAACPALPRYTRDWFTRYFRAHAPAREGGARGRAQQLRKS